MSDRLVELGANPTARRLIGALGLPIPLPQKLRRGRGPWPTQPLADRSAAVDVASDGTLADVLAHALVPAGASVALVGSDAARAAFDGVAEAWGRPVTSIDRDAGGRADLLVFDATGLRSVDDLNGLYGFFHPRVRELARNGRAVVIGRPAEACEDLGAAAAAAALDGFVRSLAKEIGRRGATANLITVAPGAEANLGPALRWILSDRAAFVTGQPLHVGSAAGSAEDAPTTRPLEGKVALVTGAARGIGADTARCLAREGAHVIVLDRPADEALAREVAEEIGGSMVLADVTDDGVVDQILAHLKAHDQRLDVVVHNAGVTRDKTLGRMSAEQWELTLAINLRAIVRMSEGLDGALADGGRVVLMSSIGGIAGNVGQTNYAATKSGVIGVARHLAPALAKRGVTINAVAPGFIDTRMTAAMPAVNREVARRLSALSQGGLPVDIAEAVTFLASPGARGLTGQVLRVCGGNFVGA